jgi:hypothetical protein
MIGFCFVLFTKFVSV